MQRHPRRITVVRRRRRQSARPEPAASVSAPSPALVAIIAGAFALGWTSTSPSRRCAPIPSGSRASSADGFLIAALAYMAVYARRGGRLGLPGGAVLTMTGGFPPVRRLRRTAFAVVGATIGGTGVVPHKPGRRSGDTLREKAAARPHAMAEGFRKERVQLPAVPAARAGVPVLRGQPRAGVPGREAADLTWWRRSYGSQSPGAFVFASVGAGFESRYRPGRW